ncbi:chaperonin 10-like protein [Daedaleopsis nitida]|nr:chaperonin 10-like protein [Daedaleopsis nitida]
MYLRRLTRPKHQASGLRPQKALVVPEPKHPWKLVTDWPVPTPGPKDALIKILSTALNPADWKAQLYAPPFITEYPLIGGLDGAGIVQEVGSEVTNVSKGDKVTNSHTWTVFSLVISATEKRRSSSSITSSPPITLQKCVVFHHTVYDVEPWTGSSVDAQANSVDFAAPWEEGGLAKYVGQAAFIVGGSSSVGQYVIQIAKLQGFSPIITTSSLKHEDLLKSLGATVTVAVSNQ